MAGGGGGGGGGAGGGGTLVDTQTTEVDRVGRVAGRALIKGQKPEQRRVRGRKTWTTEVQVLRRPVGNGGRLGPVPTRHCAVDRKKTVRRQG